MELGCPSRERDGDRRCQIATFMCCRKRTPRNLGPVLVLERDPHFARPLLEPSSFGHLAPRGQVSRELGRHLLRGRARGVPLHHDGGACNREEQAKPNHDGRVVSPVLGLQSFWRGRWLNWTSRRRRELATAGRTRRIHLREPDRTRSDDPLCRTSAVHRPFLRAPTPIRKPAGQRSTVVFGFRNDSVG
jgi:hypothetical protein